MSNNNVVTPNEQDDDEIMDQLIQEAEDSRAEVGQLEMVVEAIGNERDEEEEDDLDTEEEEEDEEKEGEDDDSDGGGGGGDVDDDIDDELEDEGVTLAYIAEGRDMEEEDDNIDLGESDSSIADT